MTPTVHGNLIVGPNAEEIKDKDSVKNTADALNFIRDRANKTTSKINFRNSIRNFAGLRAEANTNDFIIEENSEIKGFIDVAGMKSPALSGSTCNRVNGSRYFKEIRIRTS